MIEAMSTGNVVQIAFSSVLFGVALRSVGAKGQPIIDLLNGSVLACLHASGFLIRVLPVVVAARVAAFMI